MTKEQKVIARAVIQALFVKPGQHPETLRRKIADAFDLGDGSLRAAAKLTPFQWAAFLLEVESMLRPVGLSLRRGVESIDLVTTPVETRAVKDLLEELRPPLDENGTMGSAAHEVIAFLLIKEGGTVAEIEKAFETDRRAIVDRLHSIGWVEKRGERNGAAVWAIATPCLAHFKVRSVVELRGLLEDGVRAEAA